MTYLVSPSTQGFYKREIHGDAVPPDAYAIPDDLYRELIQGQAAGNTISFADGQPRLVAPPGPDVATIREMYRQRVQSHVDQVARTRLYDNGSSCASYAVSTVEAWRLEAEAFVAWRDAVWQYVLGLFAEVQAGQTAIPDLEDLIAELPVIDWP
jgi:hypothetical protein